MSFSEEHRETDVLTGHAMGVPPKTAFFYFGCLEPAFNVPTSTVSIPARTVGLQKGLKVDIAVH